MIGKLIIYSFLIFVAGALVLCLFYWTIYWGTLICLPFIILASLVLTVVTFPITYLLQKIGINVPHYYYVTRRLFRWLATRPDAPYNENVEYEEPYERRTQYEKASYEAKPSKAFDPWAVLELQKGASEEEITKAYRKKMMSNHPDKVASLDPAFQSFATERAKLIQQAYEAIRTG